MGDDLSMCTACKILVAGDVRSCKGSTFDFEKPDGLKLPGYDVFRFLGVMLS
jgi:hypothetical protein